MVNRGNKPGAEELNGGITGQLVLFGMWRRGENGRLEGEDKTRKERTPGGRGARGRSARDRGMQYVGGGQIGRQKK